MQLLLQRLAVPDYHFLVEVITGGINLNLTDDARLHALLADVERHDTPDARTALGRQIEREVRYLGSSDLAYAFRALTNQTPGVSFREIIRDVADALKVGVPEMATEEEQLVALVQRYATRAFAELTPAEQQAMLEDLGVSRERATRFVATSAGVLTVPLLIEAFGALVVNGLIKRVIFGTIARLIGRQLSARLFGLLAARLPWWVSWVGPAVWTLSIGWVGLDLQRPALRKTAPIVLYLGLCLLRERSGEDVGGGAS